MSSFKREIKVKDSPADLEEASFLDFCDHKLMISPHYLRQPGRRSFSS